MTRAKKQKEKNKMNYKKIVTFLTITALATSGPFKLSSTGQIIYKIIFNIVEKKVVCVYNY